MLIDLERNDLGRICRPGTIQVQQQMIVESYEHVHHIVSSIRGELRPNKSVLDILHAVFPGGTITGCPKVRCMQIISELEKTERGAYTGSLGYISDHGRMDMNILIRTMVLHGRQLNFRAGAGIVADSVIEKELNETRHKAKGMINALQSDY
jgi:anthranilate synthase component 1